MDKPKKMSCPHCGHKYGVFWALFPYGHKKGFLPTGKECKVCKNPLGLEGNNAQAAKRIKQITFLPNGVFWLLAGLGSVMNRPSGVGSLIDFLPVAIIYSLMCGFTVYITLHVVNFIYLKLFKDVGYLSLVPDAKHIFKSR
jgi:hypothetical protein